MTKKKLGLKVDELDNMVEKKYESVGGEIKEKHMIEEKDQLFGRK